MDNNVELVEARDRRDTDEVYPCDEIYDDPQSSHRPTMHKQNRYFIVAVLSCVLLLTGAFGAKIFLVPNRETVEVSDYQQTGTVSNNADNAKAVAEAMKTHKKKHKNNSHAASHFSQQQQQQQQDSESNEGDAKHTDEAGQDHEGQQPADDAENNNSDNDNEDEQEGEADEDNSKSKKEKLQAWHDVTVEKKDGVMYEIVQVLQHDPNSFTEGLTYYDGKLYESIGLNKQSAVLVLDPDTGATQQTILMDRKYFGEGLAFRHGELVQLTYKAKKGFVYDVQGLTLAPREFDFDTTTGEGWGMTFDGKKNEMIVSDGSAFLHFWDATSLQPLRKHQIIRLDGTPAVRINELEWWRDRVVANVWFENVLLIINPVSGLVEKEYDFSTIWEQAGVTKNKKAEVFNGISISSDPDILYVTGKWWANMFKIKLLPHLDDV